MRQITYNALNRLTEIAHVNSVPEEIAKYTYTLAADGMRVRVVEKQLEPDHSTPEDHNVAYIYDNLNR